MLMCHHPNNNTEKKFTNKSQHFKLKFCLVSGVGLCILQNYLRAAASHKSRRRGRHWNCSNHLAEDDAIMSSCTWWQMADVGCISLSAVTSREGNALQLLSFPKTSYRHRDTPACSSLKCSSPWTGCDGRVWGREDGQGRSWISFPPRRDSFWASRVWNFSLRQLLALSMVRLSALFAIQLPKSKNIFGCWNCFEK